MSIASPTAKLIRVAMSGIGYAAGDEVLETLLGSCLGIAIWCPISKRGGLAHAMLPDSLGHQTMPGRFIDTAIPVMLQELESHGAKRRCLVAKLCGGANMFPTQGKGLDVGQRNHAAAKELLASLRIPVQGEHVGGGAGRVIRFDVSDGSIQVQVGRQIVATI
ncbi:MAG: chemotaxis protein CheD [Pirellulaceae bacterium]